MNRTRIDPGCEVPTFMEIEDCLVIVDNGHSWQTVTLTVLELQSIVAFARKAGIFPSSDSCPSPAESEGVQAEAKRSPEGCLDAVANAGHCAPIVTFKTGRDMKGNRTRAECAWRYIPHCSHWEESTCA